MKVEDDECIDALESRLECHFVLVDWRESIVDPRFEKLLHVGMIAYQSARDREGKRQEGYGCSEDEENKGSTILASWIGCAEKFGIPMSLVGVSEELSGLICGHSGRNSIDMVDKDIDQLVRDLFGRIRECRLDLRSVGLVLEEACCVDCSHGGKNLILG